MLIHTLQSKGYRKENASNDDSSSMVLRAIRIVLLSLKPAGKSIPISIRWIERTIS